MYLVMFRLRAVTYFCNFSEINTRARKSPLPRVSSPRNFARVRVYFIRLTITIAKIRHLLYVTHYMSDVHEHKNQIINIFSMKY